VVTGTEAILTASDSSMVGLHASADALGFA
jgi:hypothetical protein